MHFMMGPATRAPVTLWPWKGTLTAMAMVGSFAGANAIIQSSVSFVEIVADLSGPGLCRDLVLRKE